MQWVRNRDSKGEAVEDQETWAGIQALSPSVYHDSNRLQFCHQPFHRFELIVDTIREVCAVEPLL